MSSFGISWIDKPMRNTILFAGAMACLFALLVTKEVHVPKVLLYGSMLIGGGVIFFRGMSNPELFTFMLVAYFPYSKLLVGGFGGLAVALNLTNLLMIAIVLAWTSGRYTEGESKWLGTPLNLPIILFILLGLLGIIRSTYYVSGRLSYAITDFKRWFTPLFTYFLVLNTVKQKRSIQIIVVIMIIVTTLVGLSSIYDYMTGGGGSMESSRVGGIAEQPNMLAAFFCYYMFLPLAFFYMNMGNWRAWFLLISLLIQFRGIMVTFSRGGYIAFAAGLAGITLIRSRAMFFGFIVICGMAFVFPQILPAGIRFRMGQTFEKPSNSADYSDSTNMSEENLESSSKNRIEIWKGAIEMIKDHPMFGVGYGLFRQRIKDYWSGGFEIDAHNTYLIIASELGIPALIVFLWTILVTLWQSVMLYVRTHDPFSKAVALGFTGGIFGLIVSNLFGSRLNSQEVSSYFYILSALVMRLRIIDDREKALGTVPGTLETAAGLKPDRSGKLDSCWFED